MFVRKKIEHLEAARKQLQLSNDSYNLLQHSTIREINKTKRV